ncbi:hypothetical protein FQN54_008618 [Arachnomyces sp. PD_36]|nr:hypothetical protein FQN54_008618 [Arachnomyces sp. PD_36]
MNKDDLAYKVAEAGLMSNDGVVLKKYAVVRKREKASEKSQTKISTRSKLRGPATGFGLPTAPFNRDYHGALFIQVLPAFISLIPSFFRGYEQAERNELDEVN